MGIERLIPRVASLPVETNMEAFERQECQIQPVVDDLYTGLGLNPSSDE
jgi:hypothetical protein